VQRVHRRHRDAVEADDDVARLQSGNLGRTAGFYRRHAHRLRLLEAVAATRRPLVVVVTGGSAIAVPWAAAHAAALLYGWYPGVEGGHAIAGSLDNLRQLYRRGARYMTLTWNNGNTWAGSSVGLGGTRTGGLTPFGRDVVREMNRLGMLVDVSHVSDATFYDAVAASSAPVIASHSSARALNGHRRNMTDDMLRAVARTGGVVNVNFYSLFIDPKFMAASDEAERRMAAARDSLRAAGVDSARARAELRRLRRELAAGLPATPLSVLIDHIDHVARVAGADHVGLGSDFDGVSALPEGMEDVTRLPRIAQALLDRGYGEGVVRKILGGNMMRVMQQVLDRHEAPDG
jgi:membrane dipeptidase